MQPRYSPNPQYRPSPPRRSSSAWPVVLLVVGGCLVVAAVIGGAVVLPVIAQARGKAQEQTCLSGTSKLTRSFAMYAQDYEGQLPVSSDWEYELAPYALPSALPCPSVGSILDKRDYRQRDYGKAYNSLMSSRNMANFRVPARDVILFDSSNLRYNASDTGTSLPSPPRHLGRNVLGYLDGHADALPATRLDPVQ